MVPVAVPAGDGPSEHGPPSEAASIPPASIAVPSSAQKNVGTADGAAGRPPGPPSSPSASSSMAAKGVEKEVEVSGVQSRLRVYETEEDPPDGMSDLEVDVYETIKTIRDPEFPYTLGQLRVITPDGVQVHEKPGLTPLITVTFRPTVAHCAMAQQIGLCIRSKLEREFGHDRYKIDIFVAEGSHNDSAGITKQINDKERVSAALENPMIVKMVRAAIEDPY